MFVNAASADPGIAGGLARSVPGKNHGTICKFESPHDVTYKDVVALVRRIITTAPSPAAS
jgi:hypothetical protein